MVSKNSKHIEFIDKFDILYSTSANQTNKNFDLEYAVEKSDIIIYTKDDFNEKNPSKIYKVSNSKIAKIR